MRELKSGNKILRVRASNMALLYYKQEFKKDLITDLSEMYSRIEDNITDIALLTMLQIVWAMNKAQNFSENIQTEDFEKWLSNNDDFSAVDCLDNFIAETSEGFFRKEIPKTT